MIGKGRERAGTRPAPTMDKSYNIKEVTLSVRIRLKRVGTKNRAQWRVVVADHRSPRDGRFIEEVGHYNPLRDPAEITLKLERIENWISKGARPTDTVKSLVKKAKLQRA